VSDNSKWLVVGQFGRPHGIKGFISIVTFTEPRENILKYIDWHVGINHEWQPITILETKINTKCIIARVDGYHEREHVARLTNIEIAVKISQLQKLHADQYYWHELIGLKVINQEQQDLGLVTEIMATGSNDVLVVCGKKRHLIPFLREQIIISINTSQGLITVDWDEDF
jgi:16S rRNA processing protein RimM